jgi:CheY-like chemotaxis protein
MPATVDASRRAPTSEALPNPHAGRRALWASVADRPGDDDTTFGGSPALPAEEPRYLPKVLKGVRALVVDDDEDNMELFSAALTACGAVVVTASRAEEALRILSAQRVDIVVSDIAMPGGDGYWLIGQVRQLPDPRFSSIPVVAVTAFGREHPRTRVLAAGFANHLQKPVDPEELCRTVAKAVGR